MNKQVERLITKIYNSVYKQVFSPSNVKQLASGNSTGVLETIAKFNSSAKYDEFAKKFSQELAKVGIKHEKGLWKKFYKVARERHVAGLPYSYADYEEQNMRKIIEHNFLLIKSIPQYVLKVFEYKAISVLIDEVANGKLTRGSFKRELDTHGSKNAKLIARTETSKLQSAITEQRAVNIGSVAYEWVASNDRRTRQSHKEMDGVIVLWRPDAEKPLRDKMRGNAGEFPNCRCYPAPILDITDLKKTTYKIYNYHTDKIESGISKKQLVEILERKYI